MSKAIEVDGLTKRFGELLAVDHLSFDVEEGEIFGFLGPNGAGKTTTIRMLTSMTLPCEGTARIFGHDLRTETLVAKKCFGIVPEFSNVYGELSAWNNLMFTGELYSLPKEVRQKRADELLTSFGLQEVKRVKAGKFSKGMKRRLAIAMGLLSSPRLLFLDEPTSGLDVQSSQLIRGIMRRLNEEGMTIFLTTHNMEEANSVCDRVAIISRGRLAAIDTPERLKRTMSAVQSVEVAFEKLLPEKSEQLKRIPSVNEVRKEGDKFRLFTNDPAAALSALWEFAKAGGLKILTLNTLGPTLEDVFTRLVGNDTPGDGRQSR